MERIQAVKGKPVAGDIVFKDGGYWRVKTVFKGGGVLLRQVHTGKHEFILGSALEVKVCD